MPIDGDPGWELFDESSGLAMNSCLQKINKMRAMEGELARSIQTDAVEVLWFRMVWITEQSCLAQEEGPDRPGRPSRLISAF